MKMKNGNANGKANAKCKAMAKATATQQGGANKPPKEEKGPGRDYSGRTSAKS